MSIQQEQYHTTSHSSKPPNLPRDCAYYSGIEVTNGIPETRDAMNYSETKLQEQYSTTDFSKPTRRSRKLAPEYYAPLDLSSSKEVYSTTDHSKSRKSGGGAPGFSSYSHVNPPVVERYETTTHKKLSQKRKANPSQPRHEPLAPGIVYSQLHLPSSRNVDSHRNY